MNYLLLKLAEEAGEVVVAAIKHRLHSNADTRRRLESEVGDVLAVIDLLTERGGLRARRVTHHKTGRYARELKRLD